MSVVKSERGESEMEFIRTARELQIYTVRKCVGFPKRYTFYTSEHIASLAEDIHNRVKIANSIYPTNAHEAQLRRDQFILAKAELNSLISQVEVAHELFGLEPNIMKYWMDLIWKEIRLVKGVMKSDSEHYKDLT